jgi:hypothetical protein
MRKGLRARRGNFPGSLLRGLWEKKLKKEEESLSPVRRG